MTNGEEGKPLCRCRVDQDGVLASLVLIRAVLLKESDNMHNLKGHPGTEAFFVTRQIALLARISKYFSRVRASSPLSSLHLQNILRLPLEVNFLHVSARTNKT
ncbi:Bikaverin cluster transcription factor bik5 [Fusarium oxysporum f. sp. albedinis]|nr:Bikaverin cluster transcription factor bik5 [Fusarium oxysporum f. sp. albedinis]